MLNTAPEVLSTSAFLRVSSKFSLERVNRTGIGLQVYISVSNASDCPYRSINTTENADGKWLLLRLDNSPKCLIVHKRGDIYRAAISEKCSFELDTESELISLQSKLLLFLSPNEELKLGSNTLA